MLVKLIMKQILLPWQILERNQNHTTYLQSPWDIYIPGRAVEKLDTSEGLEYFLTQAVVIQSSIKM